MDNSRTPAVENVWTADKEVLLGKVGTISEMLDKGYLSYSDYHHDLWVYLPDHGIMQPVQYGHTKDQALQLLNEELGDLILEVEEPLYYPCVVTSRENLRQLCIEQDWFNAGTNDQYEKLFYANSSGCPIDEIATIIWLCSDDVRRSDVLSRLKEEQKLYHAMVSPQEQEPER